MRKYLILVFILLASQAIAGGPIDVDGAMVDGDTSAMPVSDVREAIAAYDHVSSKKLTTVTIVSKDVIHAYLYPRDEGWLTLERTDFHESDGSIRHGWDFHAQGLPEYTKALDCIRSAQQVYVFPVAMPFEPHRDDAHMRLLDGEARSKLVELLGSPDHWFVGFADVIYPPGPKKSVGFVFRSGKDELVLFVEHPDMLEGTFNGEHLGGTLNPDSNGNLRWELKEWTAKYAQPELEAHD